MHSFTFNHWNISHLLNLCMQAQKSPQFEKATSLSRPPPLISILQEEEREGKQKFRGQLDSYSLVTHWRLLEQVKPLTCPYAINLCAHLTEQFFLITIYNNCQLSTVLHVHKPIFITNYSTATRIASTPSELEILPKMFIGSLALLTLDLRDKLHLNGTQLTRTSLTSFKTGFNA